MLSINNSIKKVCLLLLIATFSTPILAQQFKNKEVKQFLETGVSEISIVTNDSFTPETNQEMDLNVTFSNGKSVLASDYHFIWDQVTCNVTNAGWKIKGELLANGKGLIVLNKLFMYYPGTENKVTIFMELSEKKATKVLTPNYCIQNYSIIRKGERGLDGNRGNDGRSGGGDGYDGKVGKEGFPGPDISVQIDEETTAAKTYLVITIDEKKFTLDPECSSVQIISQGGEGGGGGRGGEGGDNAKDNKQQYTGYGGRGGGGGNGGAGGSGGTITVSGSAVEKYKSKITFVSNAGKGGDGGSSGKGGDGKYSGRSGLSGSHGSSSNNGQVVFKNK